MKQKIIKILILIFILSIPLSFSITYGADFNLINVINELFVDTQQDDNAINQSLSATQSRDVGERNILSTYGGRAYSGIYIPLNLHTQMSEQLSYELYCAEHGAHISKLDEFWIKVQNITFNDPDYTDYAAANDYAYDAHKTNDASDIRPGQTKVVKNTRSVNFPIKQYVDTHDIYGDITWRGDGRNYAMTYYQRSKTEQLTDNIRAYIYAESAQNALSDTDDYPSYVQLAMWRTEDNTGEKGIGDGKTAETNAKAEALYAEAVAFQNYISKLNASLAKGEPKETLNSATSAYSKDGYFLIGPFQVAYLRDFTHISGRDFVDFSGMTNVILQGDAGTIYNWEFFYENPRKTMQGDRSDYYFPYPNEEFYIKIPQSAVSRHTKIESITFQFEDMHASAVTNRFTGSIGTGLKAEIVEEPEDWCTGGTSNISEHCTTCSISKESSPHTVRYNHNGQGKCPEYSNKDIVKIKKGTTEDFEEGTKYAYNAYGNRELIYKYNGYWWYIYENSNNEWYIITCSGHTEDCGGVQFCDCTSLYGGPSYYGHYREKYYQIQTSCSGVRDAQDIIDVVSARRYMKVTQQKVQFGISSDGIHEATLTINEISGKVWLDGYESKAAEVDGFINEPRSKRRKSNTI